ncbi:MAG TPA: mobile mystery protein B [Puia sp.]
MNSFEYPPGATPLDPDEIEGLRIKHITTRPELDRWEQDNIQEALAWLEKRRNKKEIVNPEFVCLLHDKMFSKVWLWSGAFRRSNKNIGIEWQHIPVALRQLLDDVNFWIENKTYSTDEIAFRFHHLLVAIHLFPNGNGRHARLMADILLTDIFGQKQFSWGSGNLSGAGELRKNYITALRAADDHDYRLLEVFVRS